MNNTPPKNNVSILEQMENNFNNINSNKNSINVSEKTPENSNMQNNIQDSPAFLKQNTFSNLMPLLNMLNNGKNMDFQSLLKNTDISKIMNNGKSNPMLSQIMTLLPNMMNSQSIKSQKHEKNEPKIDSFVKVDDYSID